MVPCCVFAPESSRARTPCRPACAAILATASLALTLLAGIPLAAQLLHPPDPPPSFEVATIKPSRATASGETLRSSAGRLVSQHTSLRDLIRWAWAIKSDDQLEHLPDWASSQFYDVQAKASAADTETFLKLDRAAHARENRWMLQTLLADRFHLQTAIRTKTMPAYALIVAKHGPKLAALAQAPGPPAPAAAKTADWRIDATGNHLVAEGISMDQFADWLTALPETGRHIVLNRTGMTGRYSFVLDDYRPDEGSASSVFGALPSQLGLRLKLIKAPIEVLVITHADPPSAN